MRFTHLSMIQVDKKKGWQAWIAPLNLRLFYMVWYSVGTGMNRPRIIGAHIIKPCTAGLSTIRPCDYFTSEYLEKDRLRQWDSSVTLFLQDVRFRPWTQNKTLLQFIPSLSCTFENFPPYVPINSNLGKSEQVCNCTAWRRTWLPGDH
jgi:hypothetical protein